MKSYDSLSYDTSLLILGVLSDSPTDKEIRSRYAKLAKISHPDTGGDPDLFNLINSAYQIAKNQDHSSTTKSSSTYDNDNPFSHIYKDYREWRRWDDANNDIVYELTLSDLLKLSSSATGAIRVYDESHNYSILITKDDLSYLCTFHVFRLTFRLHTDIKISRGKRLLFWKKYKVINNVEAGTKLAYYFTKDSKECTWTCDYHPSESSKNLKLKYDVTFTILDESNQPALKKSIQLLNSKWSKMEFDFYGILKMPVTFYLKESK